MKYFLPFLFLLFACSESQTEQCKKAITERVKSGLNDPNSYESVSFSDLIPVYTCDKYNADIKAEEYYLENGLDIAKHQAIIDSLDGLKSQIKGDSTIEKYIIRHEYRAKNGFGGVITKEDAFTFNTSMQII